MRSVCRDGKPLAADCNGFLSLLIPFLGLLNTLPHPFFFSSFDGKERRGQKGMTTDLDTGPRSRGRSEGSMEKDEG